jgi:hypothetical protein
VLVVPHIECSQSTILARTLGLQLGARQATAISNNWHLELSVREEFDHATKLCTKPQSCRWMPPSVAITSTTPAASQGWWVADNRRKGGQEVDGRNSVSHVDAHKLQ